ncbi:hypothetical protein [Leptospira mtsangambouensis]|uniref:hypothetical protein n=1 Tax=Leptospira mtsangambouensis TaxID=2484912 RepID=UPI001EEA3CBA|nr:hypothetical protein [Leptospira mtsangambouensis]MCG6139390.1 hypothetical protein [Leptospira mtsangambouensis]
MEKFLRIILKFAVLIVIAFCFQKLIAFTNTNQARILFENLSFLSADPPLVGPWLYRDIYYQLGCFFFFISFGFLYLFVLPNSFLLHDTRIKNLMLIIWMITILLTIKLKPDTYSPFKKYLVISFITAIYFVVIFRNHLIQDFYRWMVSRIGLTIFAIVIISTTQRFVALYFDPFFLAEGDDPKTYFSAAKALLEGKDFLQGSFSKGMTVFLYYCFLMFGEGQVVPKVLMILVGTVGLYCLLSFILDYTKSNTIVVLVGLFYLFSSHYVSFSNQFWNENLFHPFFSIYLFLFYRLKSATSGYLKVLLGFSILPVVFVLTELRSWFPVVFILTVLIYFIINRRLISNAVVPVATLLLFFVINVAFKEKVDRPSPLFASNNMEFNFLVGNNPYAQGTYSRHWFTYSKEINLSQDKHEIFRNVLITNLKNPDILIHNLWKKTILWFWGAGGPRPISIYYQNPLSLSQTVYRCLLTIFLFIGIYRSLIEKDFLICSMYLLIFSVHLIFFADYRFTLTAMPLQAILVSYGVLYFWNTKWFQKYFLIQQKV